MLDALDNENQKNINFVATLHEDPFVFWLLDFFPKRKDSPRQL
jgi:hypothetical protein